MKIQISDHFTYKKLLRFCLPTIGMMIFTSLYGIVDGYFVSNFVGKTAFAAVNLVWPVIMIFGCFGFMIGTGGSALVGKTLGEEDPKRAQRYFSMLTLLTALLGVVLSVIGIVAMPAIAHLLGATEEMMGDCILYGRIMVALNVAFMLQYFFQSLFVTAGKPQLGFLVTIAAGVTNILLDALFVAAFRWGIAGAAWASVIGECVGGILPLLYFARSNDSPLRFVRTKLELAPLRKACLNGSSELMSNISANVVAILYNLQLLHYAGENGVAAYGVVMYTQMIFAAIFMGYAIGTAPIVSYHYGAAHYEELKNMLKKSVLLMLGTGVAMLFLAWALARPLALLFVGYDETLCEMTRHALWIYGFSFILCGLNMFASSFFTALNNGGVSAAIAFLRTLVFQSIAVLTLPLLFKLDGIWWAVTVAEVFALFISTAFLIGKRKEYHYL